MNKEFKTKFTIVVSTYNRSRVLTAAIQSILNQSYQDFEIIISDDASMDDTKAVVQGFKNKKIIYLCNKKKSGLSATRNSAIEKASGEYVIFMDDDAVLSDNFLETLNKLTYESDAGIFCPKISDLKTGEPFTEFRSNSERKSLGFFEFNFFRGGAHIIKTDVLKKNGLFDEKFGVGATYHAAEESDYFFRLKKSGERILYCPELNVSHPKEEDPSADKVFNYSYGIAAMLMKHLISDIKHSHFYFVIIVRRVIISLLRTLQYDLFPEKIEAKNKVYKYRYFLKGTLCGIADYLRFK